MRKLGGNGVENTKSLIFVECNVNLFLNPRGGGSAHNVGEGGGAWDITDDLTYIILGNTEPQNIKNRNWKPLYISKLYTFCALLGGVW